MKHLKPGGGQISEKSGSDGASSSLMPSENQRMGEQTLMTNVSKAWTIMKYQLESLHKHKIWKLQRQVRKNYMITVLPVASLNGINENVYPIKLIKLNDICIW